VDPRPDGRTARIEQFDLTLDQDEWRLNEPATLAYGDTYALSSFLLEAGEQAITIDGTVVPGGALDITIDFDSTDVATVADLVGFPGLEGWIGGRMRLEGPTTAPAGQAYLRGALHRSGQEPTRARASVHSDGTRLSGDVDLRSPEGGHMRVDGSVRLPGAAGAADSEVDPLDLRIRSDSTGIGAAMAFFDVEALSTLEGRLDADITVRGELGEPSLDGSLEMRDGRVGLPALGVTWEDMRLFAHGRGSDLVIDSARVASGSGEATLVGTVSLTDSIPLDLAVWMGGFEAIRTRAYQATVSGTLAAGGDLSQPVIEGDVSVESLDVFLDERIASRDVEEVELTEEDLRMLRDRFGYVPATTEPERPLTDRLTADVTVELGRDSWLRKRSSPELSAAFTGDLEVQMRPGEAPRLDGSITTIEGRGFVQQFGRRFQLREGTIDMNGPPADAEVDLSATYTVPSRGNPNDAEATIVLHITGTQQDLSLELSSEPPMENADIVSYIATGRPAGGALSVEASESQGGGVASAGADLALGQLTGVIEGAAARSVGLDVVEIRQEGFREATLAAGKYVSPRVYVGFAHPLTLRESDGLSLGDEGQSEIEVEIEALRWLLINLEGSGSALRLFLKGRYAY
jgi:translocation and assembly module TamB